MTRERVLLRVTATMALAAACSCAGQPAVRHSGQSRAPTALPPAAASPVPRQTPATTRFGSSVEGRPLTYRQLGSRTAPFRVLVVGVVHGDEAAGLGIAEALTRFVPPSGVSLIVVPDLNPDGAVRGTRQNAHGVDLNRNFPYRWTRLGKPGDQQYAGPRPLSEPESQAMAALVKGFRPSVTIWFHQPVGVVDLSGGDPAVEIRFARLLGVPVRRLVRYPGSAASWENAVLPGSTAFVVELPLSVTPSLQARAVAAVESLARQGT